jgi:hypothetical protein
MKKSRLALFAVFLHALAVVTAVAEETPAASYPPHTLPNSQLRVLPRNAAGRQYQLYISLPRNYAKDTSTHYPVVFVTDGYWDFVRLDTAKSGLIHDKYVPEFIIVGLGYPGENLNYSELRKWELSPVSLDGDSKNTGHAADFLRTLETDIIPYIDREFRTDPAHRVLAGASLGGLFTLYSMYTKPELFSGYIAVTPAVIVANDWLLGDEDAFVKAGHSAKGRLFVSVGSNESPNFVASIFRYNQRVSSRKHPELVYEFRIIDGFRHGGMQLESYVRGLAFVFAPLAPESGPSPDM